MPLPDFERRTVATEFEYRSMGDGGNTVVIEGYAYKFNARSQNLGGFKETVLEGAGAESIANDDIRALRDHTDTFILGRNTSGTLDLSEDSTGLLYRVTADRRISYVNDLYISLERGDVTQSSFGFRALPDGEDWNLDPDGTPIRSLRKITIFDVSPVTNPAYLSSEAGIAQRALSRAAELRRKPVVIPDAPPLLPVDPALAMASLRVRF